MNLSITGIFALLIGAFLLIEGVWGEFSDVIFGALTTNRVRATIHILLGLIGIWTAFKGGSRMFLIIGGIIIALVGVLWFLPPTNSLMVSILAVNQPVAILNIIVGAVALAVAFLTNRSAP